MATSKAYKIDETSTVWTDSTGDLAMTLQNLAFGAGRQGAVLDLGVGSTARANRFNVRVSVEWETAPVVGEVCEVYIKRGDGTDYDNDDGTGDIALSHTDKLQNCLFVGVVAADEAAADIPTSGSWVVEIDERYVMPILVNKSAGDNLQNTANVSTVTLTPMPQGQAT
jgi:hypothetical protein